MPHSEMQFSLNIMARRLTLALALIAIVLAALSITGKLVQDAAGDNSPELLDTLVRIFNVNRERSVPTWYASVVLLLGGLVSGLIAVIKRARRDAFSFYWLGLSALFIYFSADEAAELHEYFTEPLGEALETTGPLYFAWIIVGALAVIFVGLIYLRFWLRLPPRIRWLHLLAAVCYVGGGIGVEMIGSNLWYLEGGSSLAYSAVGTVEELLEMLGAVIFLYAQLAYLALITPQLDVRFVDVEVEYEEQVS